MDRVVQVLLWLRWTESCTGMEFGGIGKSCTGTEFGGNVPSCTGMEFGSSE